MKGYKRDDVQTHSNGGGCYGPYYPAVNVKAYHFPNIWEIQRKFNCSEKTAERAGEYAFDMHAESFWQDIPDTVEQYFGRFAKVYSAGRSVGWLIVEHIGTPEEWDGVQLNRWACFERAVKREVKRLCSEEAVFDSIEIRGWAEEDTDEDADDPFARDYLEGKAILGE